MIKRSINCVLIIIILNLLFVSGCKTNVSREYKIITSISFLKEHADEFDSTYIKLKGNVYLTVQFIDKPAYMIADSTATLLVISGRGIYPAHGHMNTQGFFVAKYHVKDTLFIPILFEDSTVIYPEACE